MCGAAHSGRLLSMCTHHPQCPPVDQPGWDTACVLVRHADLGWSLLCNGAIVLDPASSKVIPLPRRPRKALTLAA